MSTKRAIILLVLYLSINTPSWAQTFLPVIKNIDLERIDVINNTILNSSIVVIKNENDILPLERLDTLKILSLRIGSTDPSILSTRMMDYSRVEHQWVQDLKNLDILDRHNLTIVNVSEDFSDLESLDELIKATQPIMIWEGSVKGISKLKSLQYCRAVLLTQVKSDQLLDWSIQTVFGGRTSKGVLNDFINASYPKEYGIFLEKRTRFGFKNPEEVGMDGSYMKSKLDSIARMAIDSGVAPGIQVMVAKDQEIIYHETWGYHTYNNQIPVKKSDVYDLASVTKITGALPALMKLHDEGKFDLDGKLGDYIPYFKKGKLKDVTIRQILSHNGGLEAWIPYWTTTVNKKGDYKRSVYRKDSTEKYSIKLTDTLWLRTDYKKKIYKMIRKSDVDPDQGYLYSGLSFYLWPEIVSNLSGEDFEKYLDKNFYEPLGSNSLGYNPLNDGTNLNDIVPTEIDTFFRQTPLHGVVHDEGAALMGGVSSNAGLFSNTIDLAKIIQMYLNRGVYGGERFISENTIEKFILCHYCNEGNRRGLAFDKPVLENKQNGSTAIQASDHSFGHSGYTGTFTWADPENGILFVFMSNRVYPTRNNRKLYQLNIRPSMHQVVYDSIIH